MSLVVAIAGLGGFLASVGFLGLGMEALALRYFLSVIIAYLLFIGCISIWVRAVRRAPRSDPNLPDSFDVPDLSTPSAQFDPGGGNFSGGGAQASFGPNSSSGSPASSGGGIGDAFDLSLDELLVILALVAAVLSGVVAAVYVVMTAPALFAEVFVDAMLSVGLYRRLTRLEPHHWLAGVLRRTAVAFLAVAVFFVVAGIAMQLYAPEAASIGAVWQHYKSVHQ